MRDFLPGRHGPVDSPILGGLVSEIGPLDGPLSITVPALDLVTVPVVQVVPGGAPTIVADYELRVGTWGGEVESRDGFPITKLP